MVQIIDEMPKRPKFTDQLLGGIQQAGQRLPELLGNIAETQAISKQFGPEIAALGPELRREYIKAQFTGKLQKKVEKEQALAVGLDTIGKMRSLLSSAGGWTSAPGTKLRSLFPGELQKQRAELESLGRSLIPLVAAGVPIRNQREFDEYRKVITDPSASPSQLEGALNGLEGLFQRSILQGESMEGPEFQSQKTSKTKFNKEHPEHRAKAQQLMKKFNDKARVRQELEREFEF